MRSWNVRAAALGYVCLACMASPAVAATEPDDKPTAVEERLAAERAARDLQFVITPHRPNYVMAYTHNRKGNERSLIGVVSAEDVNDVKDEEVKFQISFKLALWQQVFNTKTDLFFAFTSTAWWQLYSDDISSPFRETNYEPELFLRHYGGPKIFGVRPTFWDVGLNHQSNGRADPISRSWNRVTGGTVFDFGDFALGLRGWLRLPEDDDDDNNPNMYRYYGYGEARLAWAPNKHTVTAMVRPGTEKFSYELTWSYPLPTALRLYVQYFNGYGESLLDYNLRTERIGFGVAINDFLQRQPQRPPNKP